MGCTSSALTTFDRTSNSATDTKLDTGSGGIDPEIDAEIAEIAGMKNAGRMERVLPASDNHLVLTNVDSSNESTPTATASDIHIIDMESESAPVEEEIHERSRVKKMVAGNDATKLRVECPPAQDEAAETIVEDLEGEETTAAEDFALDTGQETECQDSTENEQQRPTRWEALADVAAELPPKLTIDPLTGQIYSLSKRD